MLPQQYCLRWRYHHSNLQTMFSQLLEREAFCDVTLACEGKTIKAHKIVLSACSTYFDTILSQYEEKDPILIMKDVKYIDIKCLVEFMYKGEINVDHCHLATLLKTAEDLRIKGLAEVSWKDDDTSSQHDVNNSNGIAAMQNVSTVMDTPQPSSGHKRKRGRPPIDDYDSISTATTTDAATTTTTTTTTPTATMTTTTTTPKIVSVTGGGGGVVGNHVIMKGEESGGEGEGEDDGMSDPEEHQEVWEEEEEVMPEDNDQDLLLEPRIRVKTELTNNYDDDTFEDNSDYNMDNNHHQHHNNHHHHQQQQQTNQAPPLRSLKVAAAPATSVNNSNSGGSNNSNSGTPVSVMVALEKEWPDVVKMNDYLNTGRRQQFWEEPFTRRVMDAIKHKNLEMKIAAELLGVSYGTLYGRYRDAYGCLKHPYSLPRGGLVVKIPGTAMHEARGGSSVGNWVRDFWTEQGPTDILMKLKRKEITLFRAAEQLNVTPQTLSNYLISMSMAIDTDVAAGGGSTSSSSNLLAGLITTNNTTTGGSPLSDEDEEEEEEEEEDGDSILPDSGSVLAHCPDITIIKKEKLDGSSKVNNNEHAD